MKNNNECSMFCGIACVSGNCPNSYDDYYQIIYSCIDCFHNKGCSDCIFFIDGKGCDFIEK